MILLSSGMGLFTELWKLTKAVRFAKKERGGWTVILEESYATSPTKAYDDIATSHLMYGVAPLLVGYALYSLVTGRHKGASGWAEGTGSYFVVASTPQLPSWIVRLTRL